MLPTFPLGYFWHLKVFAGYYQRLDVYREEVIIPLGIVSMLVQGFLWAIVYERMFAGEPIVRGAVKFGSLAAPLAWSFLVVAVAAKHRMNSAAGYLVIETAFVAIHYLIVSPLIAWVFRQKAPHASQKSSVSDAQGLDP